jgi:hypothetical protein
VIIWIADREGLLTTLAWQIWPAPLSGIAGGAALAFIGICLFPVAYLGLRDRRRAGLGALRASAAGREPAVLSAWWPLLGYTLNSTLGVSTAPVMIASGVLVVRRHRGRRPGTWRAGCRCCSPCCC